MFQWFIFENTTAIKLSSWHIWWIEMAVLKRLSDPYTKLLSTSDSGDIQTDLSGKVN
jgi:hypothetical protein